MTSQPGDPRPDPFTPGGAIDPTHPPVPIPAASAATLQRELDTFRQIALSARPAFEVPCCELPDAFALHSFSALLIFFPHCFDTL